MAEPTLAEEGVMMLDHPMLAVAIQRALVQHRPRPSLGDVPSQHPYDLTMALSLLLVAVDQQGKVIGVLMALPPVRILGQFLQAGVPLPDILIAARTVIKLKAVAVDPEARKHRIGTALISLCVQLYTGLGWRAIYGQFDKHSTLNSYYTRLGFTVLGPRKGVDFSHLASFPLNVLPLGGERLFVRWLDDAPTA
jgi:predicted N-acetyltransferase YhbS